MHIQRNWSTVVGYFRPSRKCFAFNGCFIFLFILIAATVQLAAARPGQEDDSPHDFNGGHELSDFDNSETQEEKMMGGKPQENHPTIIYKEDFVSEDYVLPNNAVQSEKHKRRYNNISNRRRYNKLNITDIVIEEKPEKMLFDIIPEKPIIVAEDMKKYSNSYMKLLPLVDNLSDAKETSTKDELAKMPKKFHNRSKRSACGDHFQHRRNPYFRHLPKSAEEVISPAQNPYVKHSVSGKKHNSLDIPIPGGSPFRGPSENVPISFDNRVAVDENDRVIFSGGRTTRPTTKRPMESIFRDPRPQNWDFSWMNPQRPATSTTAPATTTKRPMESIFRDPRPENWDFSWMNPQGTATSTIAPATTTKIPMESIFRDPRPENWDFSWMNPQGTATSTIAPATTTKRPMESIFRDPRPENWDFSWMNPGQQHNSVARTTTRAPTTVVTTAAPTTEPVISQCVWAIVHCCTGPGSEIRYSCFELYGCHGAFWDINPCAENVRDRFINFVNKYYE